MAFRRSFLVLGLLLAVQLHSACGARSVAMAIDPLTGLLSSPVLTPTGGKGEQGLLASGVLAGPDSLFVQDAVVVDGHYLFAVNPGSNTLSLFDIPDDCPTYPTLIGKPADTLGQFPVSVAYSSRLEIACVLNGGAIAGVACFSVDSKAGLTPLDKSLRSISALLNQTTPPQGPTGTASDILFNPSSTALFAIVKGVPGTKPGVFFVYPVVDGVVSTDAVISTPATLVANFGSVFLGCDHEIFVTEANFGASIVKVSSSFEVTEVVSTTIPNSLAPCWSVYAPTFQSVFVLDALRNNVTVFDPKDASIKGYVNFPATAAGGFDAKWDRSWLYVLSGDPAVLVFELDSDVSKITLVQKLDLSALGSRIAWEGMAIYSRDTHTVDIIKQ